MILCGSLNTIIAPYYTHPHTHIYIYIFMCVLHIFKDGCAILILSFEEITIQEDVHSHTKGIVDATITLTMRREIHSVFHFRRKASTQTVDSVPRCPWHGSETTTREENAYLSCASPRACMHAQSMYRVFMKSVYNLSQWFVLNSTCYLFLG